MNRASYIKLSTTFHPNLDGLVVHGYEVPCELNFFNAKTCSFKRQLPSQI